MRKKSEYSQPVPSQPSLQDRFVLVSPKSPSASYEDTAAQTCKLIRACGSVHIPVQQTSQAHEAENMSQDRSANGPIHRQMISLPRQTSEGDWSSGECDIWEAR